MKTISKVFLFLLAVAGALSVHSCTKDGPHMANSISIEVTNIGYATATVKLKAKTPDNVTGYMVGFRAAEGEPMCDVMEISSYDMASEIFDAKPGKGEYEAEISGLKPGTKYNIRGFIMEGLGTATWGKTQTFRTKAFSYQMTTETASEITFSSAVISGKVSGTPRLSNTDVDMYFVYGTEYSAEYGFYGDFVYADAEYNEEDGTFTARLEGLNEHTKYYFRACGTICGLDCGGEVNEFTTTINFPELVDLGLSVKWASFNLGASKPEDYGGYYQWAGLEDVTSTSIYLDLSNCPYHTGTTGTDISTGWTKYVPSEKSSYWSGTGGPDDKTVLDPEDDVAHVKLGGKWRMPTREEFEELMNTGNCSWTWTTINGIEGYKVQSKKDGYTDNWIFLPAADIRNADYLHQDSDFGFYWSSSLDTDYPCYAYHLGFHSRYVGTDDGLRFYGPSVRPVSE